MINQVFFLNKEYKSYSDFLSFFKWLDEYKTFYPKLQMKYLSEENRAVFAKSKIEVYYIKFRKMK